MASVSVKGAKELASALEATPDRFRREARKAFAKSAPRVKAELGRSASSYMPDRYADEVRKSLKVRTRRSGSRIGVTVTASAKSRRGKARRLGVLNQGRLRHPTYGHKPWVTQTIRPGWSDDAFKRESDAVRRDILAAVDVVVKRIARGR